uniref:Glycine cleavage system H protein n=1 Tax=Hemiselmis tepida TaxID=464990 RepID=A0A7S0VX76_9CRYP|mmetsp:Transcript_27809/g.70511  ORF Transcript_27809/g.70511 Transcript_27809/m.70511 type:complete len:179 (+) Transcript_27809:3-539(+)
MAARSTLERHPLVTLSRMLRAAISRAAVPAARRLAAPRAVASQARFISSSLPRFAPKYAKSHEYADVSGDIATVGISDHAQGALGDIVFIELPEVGAKMEVGESFSAVESVKAASDVYGPVSGEIIEVNDKLGDEPDMINKDAEAGGWIVKVKMSNPSEADGLMDAAAYAKHLEEADH